MRRLALIIALATTPALAATDSKDWIIETGDQQYTITVPGDKPVSGDKKTPTDRWKDWCNTHACTRLIAPLGN